MMYVHDFSNYTVVSIHLSIYTTTSLFGYTLEIESIPQYLIHTSLPSSLLIIEYFPSSPMHTPDIHWLHTKWLKGIIDCILFHNLHYSLKSIYWTGLHTCA